MRETTANDIFFTDEDLKQSGDVLRTIMIKAFISEKVTYKIFSDRFISSQLNRGLNYKRAKQNRNNTIKNLKMVHTLTYPKFVILMKEILHLNMTNMTCTFYTGEGKKYELGSDTISY